MNHYIEFNNCQFAEIRRPSAWNVLTFGQVTLLIVIDDAFYAGMQGVAPRLLVCF